AALQRDVDRREQAVDLVRAFASYEELGDHGITELAEARALADGLSDSLCAYGEQAEAALHFLLTSGANQ
ncbi:hypothetical protein, partial [Streptomyces sp. UNOC14_S4]|uniref:hypothetical protein n=1 Tax=Streptomyces sp. UNOC14_S4 TaxID=2872340 RepID=UPI001E5257BD